MKASERGAWPRGLPRSKEEGDEQLGNLSTVRGGSIPTQSIGVIQSLCDGDADVDLVSRQSGSLPLTYDNSNAATNLIIPRHAYTPYNAQATVHMYNAFWGLYLPFTVPEKVSDIWRSYFSQRISRDLGLSVLYAPPVVSKRHANSSKDWTLHHNADMVLSEKTSSLLTFLSSWDTVEDYLPARLEKMYIALYERDFIDIGDVVMLQQWLGVLRDIGFDFPTVTQEKRSLGLVDQPMIREQPFRAYPYFNAGGTNNSNEVEEDQILLTYPQYLESQGHNESNESTWQRWLTGVDRSKGPKSGVLKLVMMTKDEWPILKKWVLYHGALIGFENLYILDGSSDVTCTLFLRQMRDSFGANVIFTPPNLNELSDELSKFGRWISGSSDITIKVDTDEFLVIKTNTTDCNAAAPAAGQQQLGECILSPYGVREYLAEGWKHLVSDGRRMRVAYFQNSRPSLDLCQPQRDDDHIGEYGLGPIIDAGWNPNLNGWFKSVMDSRSFSKYDIGGHKNVCYPPHNDKDANISPLSILHFHARCLETEVENSLKAVISHGYATVDANTSREELLTQLRRFTKPAAAAHQPGGSSSSSNPLCENGCFRGKSSCHKITQVASYLSCPLEYTRAYYSGDGSVMSFSTASSRGIRNPDFQQFLEAALDDYATIVSDSVSLLVLVPNNHVHGDIISGIVSRISQQMEQDFEKLMEF